MCLWLPKGEKKKCKAWFLFLLEISQNEFHNWGMKPLHRCPWKHQLDCLLVIFPVGKRVSVCVTQARGLFVQRFPGKGGRLSCPFRWQCECRADRKGNARDCCWLSVMVTRVPCPPRSGQVMNVSSEGTIGTPKSESLFLECRQPWALVIVSSCHMKRAFLCQERAKTQWTRESNAEKSNENEY